MSKKIMALLLAFIICIGMTATGAYASGKQTYIEFNGKKLQSVAQVRDGDVKVPLKELCELAAFKVMGLGKEKGIVVSKPGRLISLKVGEYKIKINDHEINSMAPVVIGGKTYVSLDFMSNAAGLFAKWDKTNGKVIIKTVKENTISIKTIKEYSETKTLLIDFQYPKVQGVGVDIEKKINLIFEKAAQGLRKSAEESEKELAGVEYGPRQSAGYMNYSVKFNERGLLSLVIDEYLYTGGAHGMPAKMSYTFDLKTGQEIKLADLFKAKTDYMSPINKEIKRLVPINGYEPPSFEDFKSIRPDHDFYITNDTVVVYFQAYEYTAYVYGMPEFEIAFTKLASVMKPLGQ